MNIIDSLGAVLGKGKQISRFNFDCQYMTAAYEKAVSFANQNINIVGVRELLERLKEDYKEYCKQRAYIKNQETQNESSKYDSWERISKIKFTVKWVLIVDAFLVIFTKPTRSLILLGIWALFALIFCFGIIVFIVLEIMESRKRTLYQSYVGGISKKIDDTNRMYLNKINAIEKRIDDLYLLSLDPMQKQLVLMQRAQEQQHQEMLRLQQAYQHEHETLLREQKKTRYATERLLEIEQQREWERKNYR